MRLLDVKQWIKIGFGRPFGKERKAGAGIAGGVEIHCAAGGGRGILPPS